MTGKPVEMTKLTTMIPKSLHRRVALYAVQNEVHMKRIVAEALQGFLSAHHPGRAK
jgi:hypothetical protein